MLVVDDEASIRRVIAGYLQQDGFEVFEAADGLAAIGLAREHLPDVVVLDLMLPGLDGVEVCRQPRTFSDAYVVMLTARHAEIDKLIGLSVGADDYLTKAVQPSRAGLPDPGHAAPPPGPVRTRSRAAAHVRRPDHRPGFN